MTTVQDQLKSKEELRELSQSEQFFYGNGKVLLSGEYFILDGAQGLALPLKVGQSLSVKTTPSFDPKLTWKSYDIHGNLWFESQFEFWHFKCLEEFPGPEALKLQSILQQARAQNSHFLRESADVLVETRLGFPREWGLGTSSTLIYNISQWAYISPYELLSQTIGGSGYDISCAQSDAPLIYQRKSTGPHWSLLDFNPAFKDQLFFVYLGKKQCTQKAIEFYKEKRPFDAQIIVDLTEITKGMARAQTLEEFETLIQAHEDIVSQSLDLAPIKLACFNDYWGEIKSLGAWGGDFVLATSSRSYEETKKYFEEKLGHGVIIPYETLVGSGPNN